MWKIRAIIGVIVIVYFYGKWEIVNVYLYINIELLMYINLIMVLNFIMYINIIYCYNINLIIY